MARTDPLISSAIKALKLQKNGSLRTIYNHICEVRRFVSELRKAGSGLQKWKNLRNKHVAKVVKSWQERGLAVSTIKENLAGVRLVTSFYKNDRISPRNSDFGVGNRVAYVSGYDKSVPEAAYKAAIERLEQSSKAIDRRVAAALRLQHDLGLRREEAFKLIPARDRLQGDRILVSAGVEGGRERIMPLSPAGKQALENVEKIAGKGHELIPREMGGRQLESYFYRTFAQERKFENYFYRVLGQVGLTKSKCGTSSHGLRHAYAQRRYQQVAGFKPRVKFETKEEFESAAFRLVGEEWREKDHEARQLLKTELGHDPDRDDVLDQYLGPSTK